MSLRATGVARGDGTRPRVEGTPTPDPTANRTSQIVRFGRRVVLEEKADTRQDAGAELLIDARRIPKGEDSCDEWFGIDFLSGDGVDEVLEIASLRPPHVARWVVDAVHFISGVVAPGPYDRENRKSSSFS